MKKLHSIFLLAGLFVVTACTFHGGYKSQPTSDLYMCDQARQMVLAMSHSMQNATVTYQGQNISLSRKEYSEIPALVFSDGVYTLHYNNGKAVLVEENTPVLTGCKVQS